MLELALLGTPHIVLDGEPVTGFVSKKVQLLLCYLAMESDHPHAREKLACLLWGEMPERRTRANLSQALYLIQRILPGYLSLTRSTIAFDTARPYQLDVSTFRQIAEQPEADVAQLAKAVSLVRGDFLEGLYADDAPEMEDWLVCERERCQRLHLSALDKLADHYERQSQWERGEDITRRLLRIEPWREAAHCRLMLALARQGKYDAALAQYETCRHWLEEELGATPAPETTALHERIRKASVSRQRSLPPAASVFVGRQAELHSLGEWMDNPDCRLITLVGPGGVGKTRLAQELAARSRHRFLDDICYVSLGSITQPEFIITAVAEAASIQLSSSSSPQEHLITVLAGQDLLVLLDSFEHLMAGAGLVADILRDAPQLKIIATSREKLDLQGEWVFAVDGLATPPEGVQDTSELERYDAVACLLQRARQQRNDFTLRGQEVDVVRLCRILNGSPLGIELAAALLPVLSCAQIVAEVVRSLDVLVSTQRDVPERHRSLRAVFDHSWRLLSADEQQTFARLSVFRGGFTLEASQRVTGATLAILGQLAAKSLLRVAAREEDAPARYEIHENLRQYAQEVLEGEPEQQVQAAHTAYYAELMERQEEWWLGEESQEILAVISRDLDNIRVAWQRAVIDRDLRAIGQLVRGLYWFYEMRGWYQERSDLFAPALESLQFRMSPEEQLVFGQLSAYHAWNQLYLGKLKEAHRLAQQSVDVLRQHEPGKPLAHALNTLGVMRLNAGDYDIAREIIQESLATYRVLSSRRECFRPLLHLGDACTGTGDYEAARKILEEGLALCYEEGIRYGVARFLHNLGLLHRTMGDLAAARHYYEQALPVCDEVGLSSLKGCVLISLGAVCVRQEQFEPALADCQAGMALIRQSNVMQDRAWGLIWQGLAHHGLGDERAAYGCIGEGLEIALKIHNIPTMLGLLMGGAVLLLDSGRQETGAEVLMMVARHPATDQDDRAYALELLARQGITLPDGVAFKEDRPVAEVGAALLVDLKTASPALPPEPTMGM